MRDTVTRLPQGLVENVMAKKIPVGDGYEVEFLERGKGKDSPSWQGQVHKDGKVVGQFRNDGRGGPTHVEPRALAEAFRKLVDAAAPEVDPASDPEREGIVISFAELSGYYRSVAGVTLAEVVREFAKPLAPTTPGRRPR
jgi:hypothetical protein